MKEMIVHYDYATFDSYREAELFLIEDCADEISPCEAHYALIVRRGNKHVVQLPDFVPVH